MLLYQKNWYYCTILYRHTLHTKLQEHFVKIICTIRQQEKTINSRKAKFSRLCFSINPQLECNSHKKNWSSSTILYRHTLQNKAFKRNCSPHVKHSSLKVISLGLLYSWVVCSLIVGGTHPVGYIWWFNFGFEELSVLLVGWFDVMVISHSSFYPQRMFSVFVSFDFFHDNIKPRMPCIWM